MQLPIGGWPRDPKLAEVGRFARMTIENDIEGMSSIFYFPHITGSNVLVP